jgi:hypothetical protein
MNRIARRVFAVLTLVITAGLVWLRPVAQAGLTATTID